MIEGEYDAIIVHDPQPAALHHFRPNVGRRWIRRCHIDTSEPNPEVWDFVRPFVKSYDRLVFTMKAFAPASLDAKRVTAIPPAIDPQSPKNQVLSRSHARDTVSEFGVDLGRPMLLQVARFDPWKDPDGAIETYRIAKAAVPNLQLVLIGGMASDDPEAWDIYERLRAPAELDPDLIFSRTSRGCMPTR